MMEPALIIAVSAIISIALVSITFYLMRERFERRFLLWQQQEREVWKLKEALSASRPSARTGQYWEGVLPNRCLLICRNLNMIPPKLVS